MKNKNIENFVAELLKRFPKFIDRMKPEDLQPYMLFGDFGIYIRDSIDNNEYDDVELNEIFNFLNEMGKSDDEQVQNLLTVGVLEIITDSKKATEVARQHLKDEALEDLNLIHKFWYDK